MKRALIITCYVVSCLFLNCGEREIKVSQVTGAKCPDCNLVMSAETTIITTNPSMIRGSLVQQTDGYFTFNYTDLVCEKCTKQRKIDSEKLYQDGLKAYNAGKYELASKKFSAAYAKGHKLAAQWFKKANDKIAAIEKAEKEKASASARKNYASSLREHFLDDGLDISVWVSGTNNKNLHLRYALFNAVWTHNFQKGDLIDEIKSQGFKRVYLTDGYDYSVYFNWE